MQEERAARCESSAMLSSRLDRGREHLVYLMCEIGEDRRLPAQWVWLKISAMPSMSPSMMASPLSRCCQRCSASGRSSPKTT